jgi:hypothetical protein
MNADLDRWLAVNLMGYGVFEDRFWLGKRPKKPWWRWNPSTNIKQALGDGGPGTVVGMMKEKGFALKLDQMDKAWWAAFYKGSKKIIENYDLSTPAAAICEAAKSALEEK